MKQIKFNDKCFSLADIKRLCLEYDEEEGQFPESSFEGESIYFFIINKYMSEDHCKLAREDYMQKLDDLF